MVVDWHETFVQELTVDQKLCKYIVSNTSRKICFGYLLGRLTGAILTNIQNMFYEKIRIKQSFS